MKKLILPLLLLAGVIIAIASLGGGEPDPPAPQTSALWGESGELWNPETSWLKDFTNAGYMQGNVPIPDWPVGVNVTDFGAVPNDDGDDSAAFNAAIAACPQNSAVYVPNGRYVIRQRVTINRDYILLGGGSMFGTVMDFPEYTNETSINLVGYAPAGPGKRNVGELPFFHIPEGSRTSRLDAPQGQGVSAEIGERRGPVKRLVQHLI